MTKREQQQNWLRWLVESALMLAASLVLCEFAKVDFPFVFGGSVTVFGLVPVALVAYRHGLKKGMITCLIFAIMEMMFGIKNFSFMKSIPAVLVVVFLDYIIAFSALGLAGLFRDKFSQKDRSTNGKRNLFSRIFGNQQVLELSAGVSLAMLIRFICHFFSGITVWQQYANVNFFAPVGSLQEYAEGLSQAWFVPFYSFFYNLSYMIPETIVTLLGVFIVCNFLDLRKKEIRVGVPN